MQPQPTEEAQLPRSRTFQSRKSLLGPRTTQQRLDEARRRLRHWSDVMDEVIHSPVPFDFRLLMEKIEPKQNAAKLQQERASRLDMKVFDEKNEAGREASKVVDALYGVVKAFREAVEQALLDTRADRIAYLDRQASWRVGQLYALDPQNEAQEQMIHSPLLQCTTTEESRMWQHESAERLVNLVGDSEKMDEHVEAIVQEFHRHAPRQRRDSSLSVSPHTQLRRRRSSTSSYTGSVEHNEFAPLERHSSLSLAKGHQHVPRLSSRQARIQGVEEVQLQARYGLLSR